MGLMDVLFNFSTYRHKEGMLDFLWTLKVPKYAVIVDAKAGLMNRGIQIAIFVLVFVIPMTSGKGFVSVVKPMNEKLHVWLTAGNYSATSAVTPSYCDNPSTDYEYDEDFTYTNNGCRRAPFYADISSKSASGEFVFFNTYDEEVVTELGVETRSRYFHPGVEDLAVNLYYMYSFVPSGFVAGLLGYHSFEGRSDSKHEGDAQFQPIIRIFPSKDPATGEIYNLRDAKASDAIYTQPQGTNSKFTLGDILTHANVSLDEKWSAEVDSKGRSPLLRTTGIDLQMQVYVHARRYGLVAGARDPIYVDVSVSYFPGWTSKGWVTTEQTATRTVREYQYGVGLHFKLDGEFFIFDPWALAFFFAINSVYLGMASFVVLMIIGVFFEQKNLYREAYQDRVRPTAGAAHFLLQAVTARRLFDAIDATNEGKHKNGKVSKDELLKYCQKNIGGGKVCSDAILKRIIDDLFKTDAVKRYEKKETATEASKPDDDDEEDLDLRQFLAVVCGGSNLGEAAFVQDLDNKFLKNNEEDEARPEVSRVDSAQLVPGVIRRDTADLSTDAAAAAARKVRHAIDSWVLAKIQEEKQKEVEVAVEPAAPAAGFASRMVTRIATSTGLYPTLAAPKDDEQVV